MTDYTVSRPSDAGNLSPGRMDQSFGRYPGQLGGSPLGPPLGSYPTDYVGALSGALGQLDLNTAMVSAAH